MYTFAPQVQPHEHHAAPASLVTTADKLRPLVIKAMATSVRQYMQAYLQQDQQEKISRPSDACDGVSDGRSSCTAPGAGASTLGGRNGKGVAGAVHGVPGTRRDVEGKPVATSDVAPAAPAVAASGSLGTVGDGAAAAAAATTDTAAAADRGVDSVIWEAAPDLKFTVLLTWRQAKDGGGLEVEDVMCHAQQLGHRREPPIKVQVK